MEQATPFKPIALVVEDDQMQRELVAMLLEECDMGVIQCESAETALEVLNKLGTSLSMLYTDVNLSGSMNGVDLAHIAIEDYPDIHVVVTSGKALPKDLPHQALFMPKPWLTLDLLREAERSQVAH
ncbi:MAG: response regulator [Hyphomicrobiales bacterium]|nr:response regulator [Hyphomicrobiales bacterium]